MAHFLLILRLLAIISYWQASKAKDIVERETTSGEYLLQLINPGRNHATAETTCSDRSSWLVEIKTAALQVAFKSLLRGGAVWIGGKYRDGAWKWGDGTLVTYDGWASIRTKPASDGDCIDGRGNGWMSVDCSETRWLVCQRVKHWVVFFRSKQLEFFPNEEKTFYDAKEACRLWAAGGHLVHITSDKLDLRITQELTWRKASKLFYTSGNDILEDGVWKWGNDEPIDKNDKKWQTYRFYRDEPNGGDGENCLAKLKEGGRKWADISCNLENPYICEKDLVDDSCSAVDFCSNRGDCNVVSNKFVCRCGGYYRGRMCEIEPCQQITCRNGGVCHLTTNGPSCACKPEYQGKTCAELRYHKLEKEKCQYFISTFNKGDKTRASAFCERIGGSLTILSSSEAKNFVSTQILNLFASSSELKFWVGGSVTTDGIMQWADGSKLSSFTNDFGSCLEARIGGSHKSMKWFSSICGDVLGIICEKPTTGSPCHGINCSGHGTCKNIGCHYRCQCEPGYDGRNCDRNWLSVSISPSEITVNEKEKKTVLLTITSYVGTVRVVVDQCSSFVYDKKGFPKGTHLFTIGPFKRTDSEKTCRLKVSPDAGYSFSRYTQFTVVVISPAKILRTVPESIVVPRQSDLSLYILCEAEGEPKPTVKWYKKDRLLPSQRSDEANVHQETSAGIAYLRAFYATTSDAGKYTCLANNTVAGKAAEDKKDAYLRVKLSKIHSTKPSRKLFSKRVELSCTFEAFPKPTITWNFRINSQEFNISAAEGTIFRVSGTNTMDGVVSRETSNLTINNADFIRSVTVFCVANNAFEDLSSSFVVNERVSTSLEGTHYIFSIKEQTRNESVVACTNMKANLAKILDEKTQRQLTTKANNLKITGRICIGGTAMLEDGSRLWKWEDGSLFYNQTKHKSWQTHDGKIIDGTYVGWGYNEPTTHEYNCVCLYSSSRNWLNENCKKRRQYICERSVRGTPIIISLQAEDCAPVIKVKWRPFKDAVGITHRIQLKPNSSHFDSIPDPVDIIPQNEPYEQEFGNLSHSTTYIVKISVCPDYCLKAFRSFENATTALGPPGKVKEAIASQADDGKCIVSWAKPKLAKRLTSYKITAESVLIYYSSEAMMNRTFKQENTTLPEVLEYAHHTMANRNYSFRVQAETCSGPGISVLAHGTCVTKRAAPSFIDPIILPSNIEENGSLVFTFPAINENNGPISCVFLIVVSDGVPLNKNNQEEKWLRDLSVGPSQKLDSTYITMALSTSELLERTNTDGEIKLKIGDNATTSCNVKKIAFQSRSKRETEEPSEEFSGRNKALDKDKKYGFITVTSTPGDDGIIMYKSSKMVTIGDNGLPTSSQGWIAGVVIGILLMAIVVVLVLMIFRRRKKHDDPPSPSEIRPIPMARVSNVPEPVYANLAGETNDLRSDTDVLQERLESVYNSLKANGNKGFEDEFQRLQRGIKTGALPTEFASRPSLKKKNRYKNILPYDGTRVKLTGEGIESYINASYIQGFSQSKKFIATQGPLPSTVIDFWKMIVEQRRHVIVMLTKSFEKEKKKCETYWPKLGASIQCGEVTVQNLAEASMGSFIQRSLRITSDGMTRNIQQFQFMKWPDHDVPVTTSSFFRLHNSVCKLQRESGIDASMVVHCSAGAGRTGAFIAYDYLAEEKQNLERVDVYNCVLTMRKQRVQMVQNCDQYILVYKLLLEEHMFGNTEVEASKFSSILSEPDIEARISEEFSNLSVLGPIHGRLWGENQDRMNKKKSIVPYYQTRVVLSMTRYDREDPYINASHVEAYGDAYSMIAAQAPTQESIENFWRAAFDNNVSLIVMLTKCSEGNKEQCIQYWPAKVGDAITIKNVSVEMSSQQPDGKIIVRELHVTKEGETKAIKQYQCKEWNAPSCPANPAVILDLVSKMQQEIRQQESPTVLVHCSDGAGRTGAFCAIVNLIERLNSESVVDVFREVKDLRDCRPGMVQTLKQYRFCYQAISAYLENSKAYANFDPAEEEKVYENL